MRCGFAPLPLVMVVLLVFACSVDPPSSGEEIVHYDGETIFRGLFFGEGPVGALFPEFWEGKSLSQRVTSTGEVHEVLEAQDLLVHEIQMADPTFFERFGQTLQSGDHLAIADALDLGGQHLARALVDGYGVDPQLLDQEPSKVIGIFVAVAAVIAGVVNIAGAVNVSGVVNVAVAWNRVRFWDMAPANEPASLKRDLAVQLIVERLTRER